VNVLQTLFRSRPLRTRGAALYLAAVAQARQPDFYAGLGVQDRIDARFELYTAHVLLLMLRLHDQGEEAREVSQAMYDAYLSALDDTLRELGVGDLSVAKKMRRLGATVYTRTRTFPEALKDGADPALLEGLVSRAVFPAEGADPQAEPDPRSRPLADYLRRAHRALGEQPLAQILRGAPQWPQILA
jgi:cytochrome b pre-mRNA-processing protein 3